MSGDLSTASPCPFKHEGTSTKKGLAFDSIHVCDGIEVSRVTCFDCGASGPIIEDKVREEVEAEAILKWNERVA